MFKTLVEAVYSARSGLTLQEVVLHYVAVNDLLNRKCDERTERGVSCTTLAKRIRMGRILEHSLRVKGTNVYDSFGKNAV